MTQNSILFPKGKNQDITGNNQIKTKPNPANMTSYSSVSSTWGLSSGLQGASVAQFFRFHHLQYPQLLFRLRPAPLYPAALLGGHPVVLTTPVSWGVRRLRPHFTIGFSGPLCRDSDPATQCQPQPLSTGPSVLHPSCCQSQYQAGDTETGGPCCWPEL